MEDAHQAEYDELLTRAMRLPAPMRLDFIEQLEDTLDETHPLEISPEWAAELDRRAEEVRQGTAVLLDGDEVMREIREELRQRRELPVS